MPDIEGYCTQN